MSRKQTCTQVSACSLYEFVLAATFCSSDRDTYGVLKQHPLDQDVLAATEEDEDNDDDDADDDADMLMLMVMMIMMTTQIC